MFVVYIRDAHPSESRLKRAEQAREFKAQAQISLPILVDADDNHVEEAYTGKPERIYVIDPRGKIAYKSIAGPRGFQPGTIPALLDKMLNVKLAHELRFAAPQTPSLGAN